MASICEKAISILAGNVNSGRSYLITAVLRGDENGVHKIGGGACMLKNQRPNIKIINGP